MEKYGVINTFKCLAAEIIKDQKHEILRIFKMVDGRKINWEEENDMQ